MRNLDNMSRNVLEVAIQAAQAWEQGTNMFGQDPAQEESANLRNRELSEADIKRMIACNLETVQWVDGSTGQKNGTKCVSEATCLAA